MIYLGDNKVSITYNGVQKDVGEGSEVNLEFGNCFLRFEVAPSENILDVLIQDDENTIKVELDEEGNIQKTKGLNRDGDYYFVEDAVDQPEK